MIIIACQNAAAAPQSVECGRGYPSTDHFQTAKNVSENCPRYENTPPARITASAGQPTPPFPLTAASSSVVMNFEKQHPTRGEAQPYLKPIASTKADGSQRECKHNITSVKQRASAPASRSSSSSKSSPSHRSDDSLSPRPGLAAGAGAVPPPKLLLRSRELRQRTAVSDLADRRQRAELAYCIVDLQKKRITECVDEGMSSRDARDKQGREAEGSKQHTHLTFSSIRDRFRKKQQGAIKSRKNSFRKSKKLYGSQAEEEEVDGSTPTGVETSSLEGLSIGSGSKHTENYVTMVKSKTPPKEAAFSSSFSSTSSPSNVQSARDIAQMMGPPPRKPTSVTSGDISSPSPSGSPATQKKISSLMQHLNPAVNQSEPAQQKTMRSMTICAMGATEGIESAKTTAIQRAKEKRMPPNKPLPYVQSKKPYAESAESTTQAPLFQSQSFSSSSGKALLNQNFRTTSDISLPSRRNVSPTKSTYQQRPIFTPRSSSSSSSSSTSSSPIKRVLSPPSFPPPRLKVPTAPSSPASSASSFQPTPEERRRTSITAPRVTSSPLPPRTLHHRNVISSSNPPPPPPPPLTTTNTTISPSHFSTGALELLKNHPAWSDKSNQAALSKSFSSSSSRSNPATLSRSVSGGPRGFSSSALVSTSNPALTSSGGPVYEEITEWVKGSGRVATQQVMVLGGGVADAGEGDDYVEMKSFLTSANPNGGGCRGDDDDDAYVEMKPGPMKKPTESLPGKKEGMKQKKEEEEEEEEEESPYIHMNPASLASSHASHDAQAKLAGNPNKHPQAPSMPAPIYAPAQQSQSTQPTNNNITEQLHSLYYASKDLLITAKQQ